MSNPTTPAADASVPALGLLARFTRRGWSIESDGYTWVATCRRGTRVRAIASHDPRELAAKLAKAESETTP